MIPPIAAVLAAMEATWPPAATRPAGPFIIRFGGGGGKRVSAATLHEPDFDGATFDDAAIATAEAAMRDLAQPPLFMIRPGLGPAEVRLDAALAERGYRVVDPVVALAAPVATWSGTPPEPMSAFTVWPPLRIMAEIWAEGGIGADRIAVMDRVHGPKTGLLARREDRATGAAFVALQGEIAMLHALAVPAARRRQGSAANMLRAAGAWAQDQGAVWVSAMVTEANTPALALYASMAMRTVGHYHYRA